MEKTYYDSSQRRNNMEEYDPEPLWWYCKHCGQNEYPCCPKCVREDGKMVDDEMIDIFEE